MLKRRSFLQKIASVITLAPLSAAANQLATSNRTLNEQNKRLSAQLTSINDDTDNIDAEKDELKRIASMALQLDDRKRTLLDEKSIQDITTGLLKDTGIKANIIKE